MGERAPLWSGVVEQSELFRKPSPMPCLECLVRFKVKSSCARNKGVENSRDGVSFPRTTLEPNKENTCRAKLRSELPCKRSDPLVPGKCAASTLLRGDCQPLPSSGPRPLASRPPHRSLGDPEASLSSTLVPMPRHRVCQAGREKALGASRSTAEQYRHHAWLARIAP